MATGMWMAQVELVWGAATARGRRAENQDRYVTSPALFAVTDGMGGRSGGATASEAAIRHLGELTGGDTVTVDDVREALRRADAEIRQLTGPDSGAGTTVAGAALIENAGTVYWAAFHVGDSRVYRWTPSSWEQLSSDHSVVQELVDSGAITAAASLIHPRRHVITRALGVGAQSEADFTLVPVDGAERMLICSDGLTGELGDERIAEVMGSEAPAGAIAETLVAEAIAHGGRDNTTVVVVHARRGDVSAPDPDVLDEVDETTIPRVTDSAPDDGAGA